MAADRSVTDVLQDILRNVQDILQSEVRLAKAEIRQEATQAATAALWMTIGVVGLLSAWISCCGQPSTFSQRSCRCGPPHLRSPLRWQVPGVW